MAGFDGSTATVTTPKGGENCRLGEPLASRPLASRPGNGLAERQPPQQRTEADRMVRRSQQGGPNGPPIFRQPTGPPPRGRQIVALPPSPTLVRQRHAGVSLPIGT